MYALQQAKQQVLRELKNAVGKEFTPSIADLSTPPSPEMGDLAFPMFALAKSLGRDPAELATEIAAKIGPKELIASVAAAGPYVNFRLKTGAFGAAVLADVKRLRARYGHSEVGADQRVMVEYANLNTHKDVHVGHLRNLFLGHAVVNLLRATGYDVIPAAYLNDLGAHVAAIVWAVAEDEEGPGKDEDKTAYLSRMYVHAVEERESSEDAREAISAIHRELEAQRGPLLKTWKETRKWSLAHLKAVYKELGLPIDVWYFESDLIGETREIIEELIDKGVVTRSEGAWIVDLAQEGLGVNLLVKSDGTLLYNAKDLALAVRKKREHAPSRSIYVIDARQSLAMQQLFATLRRMGFTADLAHLSYEFVTLAEGAMSARKGNVVSYRDFSAKMFEAARAATAERHADWKEKKVDETARKIAFSAMRFAMLRQDNDKLITFDMDEALSFDGFTGPYLLYTYARTQSILKKAGKKKPSLDAKGLEDPAEHALLLAIADLPHAIHEAGRHMRPNELAQALFELAKRFSEFYERVSVLNAEQEELAAARLGLVSAAAQALENGLALLGIDTLKEM